VAGRGGEGVVGVSGDVSLTTKGDVGVDVVRMRYATNVRMTLVLEIFQLVCVAGCSGIVASCSGIVARCSRIVAGGWGERIAGGG
jgi:hypothetical protein